MVSKPEYYWCPACWAPVILKQPEGASSFNLNKVILMRKRYKETKKKRRKTFGKTADRTHKFNVNPRPMRGGTRL